MKNHYEIRGDITTVSVYCKGKTYEFLIDTDQLPKVQAYEGTWTLHHHPKTKKFYVMGNFKEDDGRRWTGKLHRYLTDAPKGMLVDHVNGNTFDNRICNLNFVTKSENNHNSNHVYKSNISGVRGVHWHKQSGKWRARYKLNDKEISVGLFNTVEEAKEALEKSKLERINYLREIQEEGAWLKRQENK